MVSLIQIQRVSLLKIQAMQKSSAAKSTPGTTEMSTKDKSKATEKANKDMDLTFKIMKLNEADTFDERRYVRIKNLILRLASENRTVKIVNDLLRVILCPQDARTLTDDQGRLLTCIQMKLHLCKDLADACKITIQQLLRHASSKVHGFIAELLLLSPHVIKIINKYLTLDFFEHEILDKSWYYLLVNDLINYETLDRCILQLTAGGDDDKNIFDIKKLKGRLYDLIAKIATNKQSQQQKKQLLTAVKAAFGFENDQEFQQLYFSANNKVCFESQVLKRITAFMGLHRNYFLEKSLTNARKDQVLPMYCLEEYLEDSFFKGQGSIDKQPTTKRFKDALEFLAKQIKRDAGLQASDFIVCFLEAFSLIFPDKMEPKHSQIERQNTLISFIRTVDVLIQKKLYGEDHFRRALIVQVLYVLRLAVETPDTVELGIFSLQLLVNDIGMKETIYYFSSLFSIVVTAYLKYPDRKKVKRYTQKIFEFYIKDKKSQSLERYKHIQFVFLRDLQENPKIKQVVKLVSNELYVTKEDIARNLKDHVMMLEKSNLDIRLLGVQYILELLEQPETDEIRKVMVQPEVLRVVYQGILALKQRSSTYKNQKIGQMCGKVIAAIGLCHSFVNDPLLLRATNQEALTQSSSGYSQNATNGDEESKDHSAAPNVIRSEHYDPLVNMKYKENKSESTLEALAVPSFETLPVETSDHLAFAQNLNNIVTDLTTKTEEKPKNFYFTLYLLNRYIETQKKEKHKNDAERGNNLTKDSHMHENQEGHTEDFKQEVLAKAVKRLVGVNLSDFNDLQPFSQTNTLNYFAIFLINKIDDANWQHLFQNCIPLLKKSTEFMHILIPYLVYFTMRFNEKLSPEDLALQIGDFLSDVLMSDSVKHIDPVLKLFDFLQIAIEKDKKIFKEFIENETKFKYVEKLFFLELDENNKDSNIQNFVKIILQNKTVKQSFMTVKKFTQLMMKIDKDKRQRAAKKVRNFSRCVFNTEDTYRTSVNVAQNQGKGFLDILDHESTIEIVNLHKNLNPMDFDGALFESIMRSAAHKGNTAGMITAFQGLPGMMQEVKESPKEILTRLFREKHIIDDWKNGKWQALVEWIGDVDVRDFTRPQEDGEILRLVSPDSKDQIESFELVLGLIFGEYYKGLYNLLRTDEFNTDDDHYNAYLINLQKIREILDHLYFELKGSLEAKQGEVYVKLFLHILYEVESAVVYLKDVFYKERERLSELLKRDVNKDRRKFERIYYEFNMSSYFEKLLSWFQERSSDSNVSFDQLNLIYYARRVFFQMLDRDSEYAFYLMQIAKLHRKQKADVLIVNQLFKECEKHKGRIVDYELEFAKYTLMTKNAHAAYHYLVESLPEIERKVDQMTKQVGCAWMPKLVLQKAQLLSIELQIKIDPRNTSILEKFNEYVKAKKADKWEKPNFKFAQYLDMLDQKTNNLTPEKLAPDQQRKRNIQKIFYYTKSLQFGHKYIWQSLPRALELWFEYHDDNDDNKIQQYMRQELMKLESFKIASALQIFLSRFGHPKEAVRQTILMVLAKLASEYPCQCSWWIYHFHFFEDNASSTNKRLTKSNQAISRVDFARELIKQILLKSDKASEKIMLCETVFGDLKKLSERQPSRPNENTMDLPKSLSQISSTNLVMPIEENLSPQLPPTNYQKNLTQKALVRTTMDITKPDPRNDICAEGVGFGNNFEQSDETENSLANFPAYKKNPVMISGFLQKVTIMLSKEKPKKIGILGTDKRVYNFLLKCDKYGDLRKEQRFIDFAGLVNKMLDKDHEARNRNLRLRTYSIVPLSRNTGLIEWIQHTNTLKSVVGDYWKKNNIKGEMGEIKKKAQDLGMGDTHTKIWDKVKDDIKPVLGNWFAHHYPSPEIWYEARHNFIKSTAIWSVIGYVIGLGDRHGDNILIHQHTGEVTHVDFDCIFEKGAKLKIPEIVPFRLTANIMDAFGIFKEKGVFQKSCEIVLRVLRKNQSNILQYLYSFIHDPLIEASQNLKVEIKDALEVVKKKLHGQTSIELGDSGAMTVEEQVDQIILNAINDESLSKMYIGWMPWL